MKKYFLVLILFSSISSTSMAQYKSWGIGVHVGEPLGVTAKKYLYNGSAIEASVGMTGIWGYNYKNAFYRNESYNREQYQYRIHRLHSAISMQAHYLIQRTIRRGNFRGLEWYGGAGLQFRSFAVDYEYRYYGDGTIDSQVIDQRLKEVSFGIDGVVGVEHSWRLVPFSVFADLTLFGEVINTPFLFYIQGGVGARYYF